MFRNVNIGVPQEDVETQQRIEKQLEEQNVYFTNEGSGKFTYNINAGFQDLKEADAFVEQWEKVVYIETETFDI